MSPADTSSFNNMSPATVGLESLTQSLNKSSHPRPKPALIDNSTFSASCLEMALLDVRFLTN